MNNVYFAKEGMTSSTANFYANIAKELQKAAAERLDNVKFFQTDRKSTRLNSSHAT